jgi:hypothetical protein
LQGTNIFDYTRLLLLFKAVTNHPTNKFSPKLKKYLQHLFLLLVIKDITTERKLMEEKNKKEESARVLQYFMRMWLLRMNCLRMNKAAIVIQVITPTQNGKRWRMQIIISQK